MKRARADREAEPMVIILGALWVLGLLAVLFAGMMMDGGTALAKCALVGVGGILAMAVSTYALKRL